MRDMGPILDKVKNLEREVYALSTVNGIKSQQLFDKDVEISSLITTIESQKEDIQARHTDTARLFEHINSLKSERDSLKAITELAVKWLEEIASGGLTAESTIVIAVSALSEIERLSQ